jgi:hypothetical protein
MNRKETPLLGIVLWMWKFLGSVSTIRVGKKRKMLLHPGENESSGPYLAFSDTAWLMKRLIFLEPHDSFLWCN